MNAAPGGHNAITRKLTRINTAQPEQLPMCPICITPLTDVADVTATFCG